MAFPFGPSPKLSKYLEWARSVGCHVQDGLNGYTPLVRITAPSGRVAVLFGIAKDEHVPHLKVENLDRTLGLVSPYTATDSNQEADRA